MSHQSIPIRTNERLLELIWTAARTSDPGAGCEALDQRLSQGFVLIADLRLDAAERVAMRSDSLLNGLQAGDGLNKTASLQALIDELTALTMEDGLTGLFNRRYFDRLLEQEVQRACRQRRPFSVLMIDADDFKLINDRHGHAAGDAVLKQISTALTSVLRATDDVTSRLGGEEFAVVLPGTDGTCATRAGNRVRDRIAAMRILQAGTEFRVTVSVGVASFDPNAPCTAAELVEQADEALYEAKAAGKNAVRAHASAQQASFDRGVSSAEKDGLLR
jgi:diguanylate cyclase (GGDEF)-like protein